MEISRFFSKDWDFPCGFPGVSNMGMARVETNTIQPWDHLLVEGLPDHYSISQAVSISPSLQHHQTKSNIPSEVS